MTTRKYKTGYTGKKRSLRDISDQKDSPCYECLVRGTCTRSFTSSDACNEYIDYIFTKIRQKYGRTGMRKSKGFTIIELLIVIAILLILFAVGFNSFIAWRHANQQNNTERIEIITQEEEAQKEMPVEMKPLNKPEGEKKQL